MSLSDSKSLSEKVERYRTLFALDTYKKQVEVNKKQLTLPGAPPEFGPNTTLGDEPHPHSSKEYKAWFYSTKNARKMLEDKIEESEQEYEKRKRAIEDIEEEINKLRNFMLMVTILHR